MPAASRLVRSCIRALFPTPALNRGGPFLNFSLLSFELTPKRDRPRKISRGLPGWNKKTPNLATLCRKAYELGAVRSRSEALEEVRPSLLPYISGQPWANDVAIGVSVFDVVEQQRIEQFSLLRS